METQQEIHNGLPVQAAPTVTSLPPKHKQSLLFLWILLGIVLIIGGSWIGYQLFLRSARMKIPDQATLTNLHTYFSYTPEELQILTSTDIPHKMTTTQDLYEWEEQAYKLVAKEQSVDVYASKVYAYLTVARRDQLLLTRSIDKDFRGDTAIISKKVLCEFYPRECGSISLKNGDAFSEKLSEIVMQKVKQRIAQDAARTKEYPLKEGVQYWQSTQPKIGLDAGSYKPWSLERGDQFRVPENSDFARGKFDTQLSLTKKALTSISSDQRKAVVFWAGGPGTKTPPGIWLDLSGEYMIDNHISVEKYMDTQALLSMAMADAVIAVFDSKYTYQIKRPFMIDTSIKTVMPTPNHPSYPAGHSTISGAALAVLAKQLPANTTEWQRLAKEAGNSRVWGGIHYSVDDEQGAILGKRVGEYTLTRFNQH